MGGLQSLDDLSIQNHSDLGIPIFKTQQLLGFPVICSHHVHILCGGKMTNSRLKSHRFFLGSPVKV